MHTVRMTAAKLQIETMRMQRELDEKNAVEEETALEWHDVKDIPNNNRNVLVYYICHGVEVQTTAHYDNAYKCWYDWCGDEIEEDVLAWRELIEKPKCSN